MRQLPLIQAPVNYATCRGSWPKADGDDAQELVANKIYVRECHRDTAPASADEKPKLIIDVGGLYGDFGITAGAKSRQLGGV
jgi:hypothetical protein